jgi:hypothetical protein
MRTIRSFLRGNHIIMCQEAHAALARANDWKWNYRDDAEIFSTYIADASKQTSTGGIVIFVRRDFFQGFCSAHFFHIVKGYACAVRLYGSCAMLQIIGIYGDSNSESARIQIWDSLFHSSDLFGMDQAFTILAGDFNIVLSLQDRLVNGVESGVINAQERFSFLRLLQRFGLRELGQPLHTYFHSNVSSRLDCAYISHSHALSGSIIPFCSKQKTRDSALLKAFHYPIQFGPLPFLVLSSMDYSHPEMGF